MLNAIRFAAYEREAVFSCERGYFECAHLASNKSRCVR